MTLKEISLPKTLGDAGGNTFQDCINLKCFVMPTNSNANGGNMFYCARGLETICLSPVMDGSGGSWGAYCNLLKNISWPRSSKNLCWTNGTTDCWSLEHFDIPDAVTNIRTSHFLNCFSLQQMTIPASVTNIGNSVFNGCSSMCRFKFLGKTPPTVANANAFQKVPTSCIIEVPAGCLEAYTTATNYPSADTYTYVEASE